MFIKAYIFRSAVSKLRLEVWFTRQDKHFFITKYGPTAYFYNILLRLFLVENWVRSFFLHMSVI